MNTYKVTFNDHKRTVCYTISENAYCALKSVKAYALEALNYDVKIRELRRISDAPMIPSMKLKH